MFAAIKRLFAKLTWQDFIIGGFNFGAGTTLINAAWNNYLYYDTSLRMIGIIFVLGSCGSFLTALELLPRPDFVQRHVSHLNSFIGRSITYLLLGLISSDTAHQKKEHRFYLYTTWLCAGTMAFYAVFFALLSIIDTWIRKVPRPKGMAYSIDISDGRHLASNKNDSLEMNKESAWTVSPADGEVSYSAPDTSLPYGDPFDQASITPSSAAGWTQHSVRDDAKLSYSSPALSFSKQSSSSSIGGASQSSYGYQIKAADSSYGDDTHLVAIAVSPQKRHATRSRDEVKASISNPLKRITYNREYSSSQDRLIPPSASIAFKSSHGTHSGSYNSQFPQSASSDITSTTDDWIARASESQQQSVSPFGYAQYERGASQYNVHQSAKLKRVSTRKHKRVYVPGIGSFDLSSGSESEGEEKRKSQAGLLTQIQENSAMEGDDAGSVYSLDSDVGEATLGKPMTTLGRKLTRTETLTYRNKLDRGMQRARKRASEARF